MITETNHQYYCSDNNYHSSEASARFNTVADFLDNFEETDIDLNLCFRFDIEKHDNGDLYAEFFLMLQRKGIFMPIHCVSYNPETESERLESYLKKHYAVMMNLWTPLSETVK